MTVVNADGRNEIRVSGDVDVESLAQLVETAQPVIDEGVPLIVDLAGLTSIDSIGLGFLIRLYKQAHREEWELSLRRPSKEVFRTFEVAALDQLFDWAD